VTALLCTSSQISASCANSASSSGSVRPSTANGLARSMPAISPASSRASIPGSTAVELPWPQWEALAADEARMLERIDLVFLNGTMTSAQRSALSSAMAAVKNTDPAVQARKRAQVALYIVATSPHFQVDR
jgi:hypothetical protein